MPEPRPILFYRVETETFQRVTNLLLALDTLLELPKIPEIIRELERNTRAVHPPDKTLDGHLKDATTPKGKKNGKGEKDEPLEPVGKEQ